MASRARRSKPIVFISHIVEEREIAFAIQRLVEKRFMGMMNVFVSSDPSSLQLGQEWLRKIKAALKSCAVEIVLASPQSIRRPWINFEAGAGWIRNIAVIPLCHSGMIPEKLPMPLKALQAATATIEDELRNIFPVLAEALGSNVPDEADFTDLITTVKKYESESKAMATVAEESSLPDQDALQPHVYTTLAEIAGMVEAGDADVALEIVKRRVEEQGFRPIATVLATKMLERKSMVETLQQLDYNDYPYWAVRVTDEGWAWLHRNSSLLKLACDPPRPHSPNDEVPF